MHAQHGSLMSFSRIAGFTIQPLLRQQTYDITLTEINACNGNSYLHELGSIDADQSNTDATQSLTENYII